jgi:hypothetical protein
MDDINKVFVEIHRFISDGKYQEALNKLQTLRNKIKKSPIVAYNFGGFAIDIGSETNDIEILDLGIEVTNDLLSNLDEKDNLYANSCYNLASGLSSKLQYNQHFIRKEYFAGNELAEKAKKYFRITLDLINDSDIIKPKAWVNYGNLLNGRLGRSLEALEAYHNAINISPKFSMALANLGYTGSLFANVIGGNSGTILLHDSYHFINNSLLLGLESGPSKYFRKIKNEIYNYFQDKSFLEKDVICSKIIKSTRNKFKDYYRNFCHKERLYLNPLGINHKCEGALYDPLTLQNFLVDIKKGDSEFFKYATYIDLLKQEYISARFLAAQSYFKSPLFKFIDDGVVLIDTLDYSVYNLFLEMGKLSFRSSYSLLDKIAYITNEYFQLGMSPQFIFFENLSPLKNQSMRNFIPLENPYFSAIMDLANDFYNGYFKKWKELRHTFEHRFKRIYLDFSSSNILFPGEVNKKQINENNILNVTDFKNQIPEILRLIKSAIFYVVLMIDFEERKKISKVSENKIAPMFAFQIKDKFKHD